MSVRLLHGDCREVLKTLPSESVHCVVTSPPYFGLRDYGTGQWTGGDPSCGHIDLQGPVNAPSLKSTLSTNGGKGPLPGDKYQADQKAQYRQECGLCGARRTDSQIGLEATPDAYVAELVAVFREVRRVMRSDATLWCNLGDSYGAGKQLQGIPWRVAFALQADGWILRQDIIWSKSNPMPESVRDRCTKAHEYLFLLSKSPRYFWDAEAIAEVSDYPEGPGNTRPHIIPGQREGVNANLGGGIHNIGPRATRNKRSVWEVATAPFSEAHFATFPPALIEPCILAGCPRNGTCLDPFAGAGTTGLVADRLGRNAVLIELNASYADMSKRRITDDAPLFAEVVAA